MMDHHIEILGNIKSKNENCKVAVQGGDIDENPTIPAVYLTFSERYAIMMTVKGKHLTATNDSD
jgi:hypothetical protein